MSEKQFSEACRRLVNCVSVCFCFFICFFLDDLHSLLGVQTPCVSFYGWPWQLTWRSNTLCFVLWMTFTVDWAFQHLVFRFMDDLYSWLDVQSRCVSFFSFVLLFLFCFVCVFQMIFTLYGAFQQRVARLTDPENGIKSKTRRIFLSQTCVEVFLRQPGSIALQCTIEALTRECKWMREGLCYYYDISACEPYSPN